jgi:acetoin:2,6-dichlorophenolindophenol oxidoreductase subunit alpha
MTTTQALDTDQLVAMYRQMLLIRRFDEKVLELRAVDELDGVVHPYWGQEAVAVGVCSQLETTDRITSTHRGHGHCIAKGADPVRMMCELFGRDAGYSHGKGGSMHIADFEVGMLGANGIVAAGLPIALGSALAASLEGGSTVTVCFFSDGAASAGPFHECLNLSTLWTLPVVWLCEHNGFQAGNPAEGMLAGGGPAALAAGYGIPTRVVDGNDVLAVRDATGEAVERARQGGGPTLIEARTFRVGSHAYRTVGLADKRPPELFEEWRAKDPVTTFARRLVGDGTLGEDDLHDLAADVDAELDGAIEAARRSPRPAPESALDGLFA